MGLISRVSSRTYRQTLFPKLTMLNRVTKLEQENNEIKAQLQAALARLDQLEASSSAAPAAAKPAAPVAAAAAKEESEDEDDDMDFFDSDDEEADAEAERVKAERIAAYNARKAEKAEKKGVVAAKSMLTLDVKPFDDETDLQTLAKKIKSEIVMDGLSGVPYTNLNHWLSVSSNWSSPPSLKTRKSPATI